MRKVRRVLFTFSTICFAFAEFAWTQNVKLHRASDIANNIDEQQYRVNKVELNNLLENILKRNVLYKVKKRQIDSGVDGSVIESARNASGNARFDYEDNEDNNDINDNVDDSISIDSGINNGNGDENNNNGNGNDDNGSNDDHDNNDNDNNDNDNNDNDSNDHDNNGNGDSDDDNNNDDHNGNDSSNGNEDNNDSNDNTSSNGNTGSDNTAHYEDYNPVRDNFYKRFEDGTYVYGYSLPHGVRRYERSYYSEKYKGLVVEGFYTEVRHFGSKTVYELRCYRADAYAGFKPLTVQYLQQPPTVQRNSRPNVDCFDN